MSKLPFKIDLEWSDLCGLTPWQGHETVAFLVGPREGDHVDRILITKNRSDDPKMHFRIGRNGYIQGQKWAKENGLKVRGVVHTHPHTYHPDGPSTDDLRYVKTARHKAHAVWVPWSRTLWIYDSQGTLEKRTIDAPEWWEQCLAISLRQSWA